MEEFRRMTLRHREGCSSRMQTALLHEQRDRVSLLFFTLVVLSNIWKEVLDGAAASAAAAASDDLSSPLSTCPSPTHPRGWQRGPSGKGLGRGGGR